MADADSMRALAWLATTDGAALLAEAAAMPDDRLTRLTRLRKRAPADIAAIAVELLELRRRARAKFDRADQMYFTPEGLEQATGDAIAAYRAGRFAEGAGVLDACSGIGGDARHLARRGPVLAVDRSPAAALCTRHNSVVRTLCADVTSLPLARLRDHGIRAAFFDPSRRTDRASGGRRRLRSGEDYAPPLHWLEPLRAHFESVAVKVSPAIDDPALRIPDVRVEFLSDRGECKEAVLWFGPPAEGFSSPPAATEPYFATVLRRGSAPATLSPTACPTLTFGAPRAYLYEPDAAVIRAHLVNQLAERLSAVSIEPGIAYMTSDLYVATPFATAFRVVDVLSYREKEVQRRLRTLGA